MKLPERYYALLPVALLCLYYAYKAVDFPVHDFANYYFGAQFLASGDFSPHLYYPAWFNARISAMGYDGIFASYAPNTPFLSLAFYPLSFFPLAVAKIIFNSVSIALFLYSLDRLASFYSIRTVYLLVIPILFFVPIKNDLLFGQVYLLLFFLLAESWLAYEKQQYVKMALWLGLAIVLKVFPVVLVFVLLFRKQFRPALYVLASCLLLVLCAMPLTGINIWLFCFSQVLPRAASGEIAIAFVDNYQSVFMFVKRIFVFDAVENPAAFFNYPALLPVLVLAFKIKLIVIGYYISRKATDSLLVFSYWMLAMILLSPYGSSYTFIFMVFPFFALIKSNFPNVQKGIGIALLFAVNNIPLGIFIGNAFPFSYLRLFSLIGFFCFLLWIAYRCADWKTVALAALLPLLLLLAENENPRSPQPLLTGNQPVLVTDYIIKNGRLTYFYWNEKGENKETLPLPITSIDMADESDGQLYYYGRKLTDDSSSKLKPTVINGKTLVYLSDLGRGIGFYTLRKIELQ